MRDLEEKLKNMESWMGNAGVSAGGRSASTPFKTSLSERATLGLSVIPETESAPGVETLVKGLTSSFKDVVKELKQDSVNTTCRASSTYQVPKFKLHQFSGETIDYLPFMKAFETQVASKIEDPAALLGILIAHTPAEVSEKLRFCNMRQSSALAYARAREILDEDYGQFEDVATAWLDRFSALANVNTVKDLKKLHTMLLNCQEILLAADQVGEFETKNNLFTVVSKLPSRLRERWQQWSVDVQLKTKKRAKLKDLIEFVHRIYLEKADPVYGDALSEPGEDKSKPKGKKTVMMVRDEAEVSRDVDQAEVNHGVMSATNSNFNPNSERDKRKPKKQIACTYCGDNHIMYRCKLFRELAVQKRKQVVQEKGVCGNCFNPSHKSDKCTSPYKCHVCKQNHHTMLHEETNHVNACDPNQFVVFPGAGEGDGDVVASAEVVSKVTLPIVPVKVKNDKEVITVYALLDTGSTCTLCTDRVVDKLKLDYVTLESSFNTISGHKERLVCKVVDVTVSGYLDKSEYRLKGVMSRPSLNLSAGCRATPTDLKDWPHLEGLQLPRVDASEIDLLIGMDHAELIKERGRRDGVLEEHPYAVRTKLGWYVAGQILAPAVEHTSCACVRDEELNEKVEKFWRTDDVSCCDPETSMSVNDRKVIDLWDREIVHDGKQYTLPIPFKVEPPGILNNRKLAEQRLINQGKRLNRSPQVKPKYIKSMRKYIDRHQATRVRDSDPVPEGGYINYLPHHWVFHDRKPDEVRSVFDAAAKYLGLCLNDYIHAGPDLMNKLIDVLLGFRRDRWVLLGDIEGMFSQILVKLLHQDCQRFLWWEDDQIGGRIVEYKMRSHIFGGVWSPSCANFTLKRTAEDFGRDFDEITVHSVRERFYVDDGMDSVSTENSCTRLGVQLNALLSRGGFNYRKMNSNSDQVIRELAEEGLIEDPQALLDCDGPYFVLGSRWYRKSDKLKYSGVLPDKPPTKRGVLSTLCSLYDPLGLIAPVIIEAKQIFQDCCRQSIGWDDTLTPHLMARWEKWRVGVQEHMEELEFDRCLLPGSFTLETPGLTFDLHLFSDASTGAYGGMGYLRTLQWEKPVGSNLVMSKGRLAPIKQQSIPRLELSGAQVSVQIEKYLEKALRLKLERIYYWVDSTIVLYYIYNSDGRYTPYVGNRVGFIREGSEPADWRHVPTYLNPADLLSRGASPEELQASYLWKHGPIFLLRDESEWPKSEVNWEEISKKAEIRKEKVVQTYATCTATAPRMPSDLLLEKTNSFYRTKRRLIVLVKFVLHLAKRSVSRKVTPAEMKQAEYNIIRYEQRKMLDKANPEMRKQYDKMYPREVDGLLRVGGRLQNAGLHPDAQHQILIPKSAVARGIIHDIHAELRHAGPQRVLYESRERYWIVGGLKQVRSVLKGCIPCKRLSARLETPLMSSLPEERVQGEVAPFQNAGVDYFGPLIVKTGRTERKRYGCLFTCMVTRAVHIELAWSLDTDSCMNAIMRFGARRGMPKRLRSDNGTNFVSSDGEMKTALKGWNQQQISERLLQKGCEWVFNTPAASHQGGVWERQIRSARKILIHLLKEQPLTDESLLTFLCLAEDILNGRPLTTVGADPSDLRPLSPNMLLRPRTDVMLPTGLTVERDKYRRRWKQVQYLIDIYWKRWRSEYLLSLQVRTKWVVQTRNLRVGDVVLLKDEHAVRNVWPMGRVLEVYPGADGVVRSVKLRTKDGEYRRPVQKLCVLEAAEYGGNG